MFTKSDGSALNPAPVALTTRLAEVFRRPGDKISDFMAEVKSLTDKDRADFRDWFIAAGHPLTA